MTRGKILGKRYPQTAEYETQLSLRDWRTFLWWNDVCERAPQVSKYTNSVIEKTTARFLVSAWKNADLQNYKYIVNKQKTVSYELRYLHSVIQKEIL